MFSTFSLDAYSETMVFYMFRYININFHYLINNYKHNFHWSFKGINLQHMSIVYLDTFI